MDIKIGFDDTVVEKIADAGFDPVYGARPLRRAIQSQIEDRLSEEILEGKLIAGNRYKCEFSKGEPVFLQVED